MENIMLSEISQSQKTITQFHLYEVPDIVQLLEAKHRIMVPRGLVEGEMRDLLINGHEVSVTQNEF